MKSAGVNSCLRAETARRLFTVHGMSETRVWRVWRRMRQRCFDKNDKNFESYGGRGIKVCKRWLKFENFFADMGEPPNGLTLERKDNNKGYSPANCYWATKTEQNRNRRNVRVLMFRGQKKSLPEWCEILGFSQHLIHHRLRLGWSVDRALSTPRMQQFAGWKQ